MSKILSEIESLKKEKKRYEKKGQLNEVAQHCSAIGGEYAKLGLYDDAIEQHQEELLLCEALNDQQGLGFANRKLGECFAEKGEFDKAFQYEKRYLEISQCEGSDVEEQRAYATLGRTYFLQIDTLRDDNAIKECLKKAVSAYLNSLEVCERLKSDVKPQEYMEMKARLLLNLGLVYDVKNDLDLCAKYLKEAIKITEKYNFTADRLRCNITLASIYQRNGSNDKAVHFLDVALKCAQQLKDKEQQVDVYCQKALILFHQDKIDECKSNLKKAYKIKTGNEEEKQKVVTYLKAVLRIQKHYQALSESAMAPGEKMKLYEKLGDATSNLGAFEQALCHYKNMLQCGLTLKLDPKSLIPAYVSLAQTYQDLKQYSNAMEMYDKEIECRQDDHIQIAKSYLNIAECLDKCDSGYDKQLEVYEKAMDSAKKGHSRKMQKQVLGDLIEVQKYFGKTEESHKTEERLAKFGNYGEEEEEEDSQETVQSGDEDSDVDLQELSSSDDEVEREEFDRSAPRVGVARKTGYKIKRNEKGETELHTASIQGNLKRVENLIQRGHPVNARDCAGWLPIHEACNHGWPAIVDYLISKGAAVNDRGGTHCDGTTPLLDVCGVACAKVDCKKVSEAATYVQRHLDIIHMLVKSGADVHAKDIDGYTALDSLILQRKRNLEDLTWEELAYVKTTEKFLKAVMQGNNPHLALESINTTQSDSEEEDSLPEITRKHSNKRRSVPVIEDESQNTPATSDSESDSENVTLVPDELAELRKNPKMAPMAYRTAMKEIGRSAAHNVSLPKSSTQKTVKTRALMTTDEYVGESWLEDDIGKIKRGKRKRTDPNGVLSTSGVRKKSRLSMEGVHDDDDDDDDEGSALNRSKRRIRTISEGSSESNMSEDRVNILDEDDNTIITHIIDYETEIDSFNPTPSTSQIASSSAYNIASSAYNIASSSNRHNNSNKRSFNEGPLISHTNEHLSVNSDLIPSTSASAIDNLFEGGSDDNLNDEITNSFIQSASNNSKFKNHSSLFPSIKHKLSKKSQQLKITSFGDKISSSNSSISSQRTRQNPMLTQTNNAISSSLSIQAAAPVGLLMRLRVKVKDRLILVPVPNRTEPVTIGWVAQETSNRYYQLCNLRPVLSLMTKDGAMFAPDDLVMEVCMNNDELDSLIERWDLPPITNRYTDACKTLKTVCYTNIKNLLHQCNSTNTLCLEKLALRPAQFLSVSRAIQCQCALKELHLKGNKIGDEGIKDLVKVLPTLPSLTKLDLSSNQITCNGLKTLMEGIDTPGTGAEKPMQALEKLYLSYNSFGDSCTLTMSKLVLCLPALTSLSLAACDFTMHFFQQHRINLEKAFKDSTIQEVDFSMNNLGVTGVELLLMCLRPDSVCSLNLKSTVNTATVNCVTKYIEKYMKQDGCVLQELYLDGCQIHSEGIPDLKRCLETNSTLQHLSVNGNKKLTATDVTEILQSTLSNQTSRLQSLSVVGCNLTSPLPTDFLDIISDKLHNASCPIRSLDISVLGLDKTDIDTLVKEIWEGKWGVTSKCNVKGEIIKLGVKQEQ